MAPNQNKRDLKFFFKYSDKTLVFYQQENKNEPYDNFLNLLNTEWNDINCISYSIPVYEGNIIIFPSKLPHSVDGKNNKKLESFKTYLPSFNPSKIELI